MSLTKETAPTGAICKGVEEIYVTYELEQHARRGDTKVFARVKPVIIAGEVDGWEVGDYPEPTGRNAHGVKIGYHESHTAISRSGEHHTRFMDVPKSAQNVQLHHLGDLPKLYRDALPGAR